MNKQTFASIFGCLLCMCILLLSSKANSAENFKIAIADLDAYGVSDVLAMSVSDLLRTEFFKTGYFHVMERRQMNKIMEEQAFQLSGATEQDMIEAGKLLAVQQIGMGSITRLGEELIINFRLVDVQEARVESAESVSAVSESQIPAAVKDLAKKITDEIPLRGKVVGMKGKDIIVSLGQFDRINKGITLRVQRLGEAYRDPETNKILGRAVIEVALLRVNKVMSGSLSSADVLDKYADIQLGDIVAAWAGPLPEVTPVEKREVAVPPRHQSAPKKQSQPNGRTSQDTMPKNRRTTIPPISF